MHHPCANRLHLVLLAIVLLSAGAARAQTIVVPGAPPLTERIVQKHRIAINVPRNWRHVPVEQTEIFARTGKIGEAETTCMIRLTSIAELAKVTPESFVDAMTKDKFIEMSAITGNKIDVHLFDTALLGGIVARRIVHTQPHNGVPLTYISHQALRGADVFTVSCYAHRDEFARLMNMFGMIIGSTRFLP